MGEPKWSTVIYGQSIGIIKDVYKNYKKYEIRGKKQMIVNRDNFNFEKMKEKLVLIIEDTLKDVPKNIPLKLPKLPKKDKK